MDDNLTKSCYLLIKILINQCLSYLIVKKNIFKILILVYLKLFQKHLFLKRTIKKYRSLIKINDLYFFYLKIKHQYLQFK